MARHLDPAEERRIALDQDQELLPMNQKSWKTRLRLQDHIMLLAWAVLRGMALQLRIALDMEKRWECRVL